MDSQKCLATLSSRWRHCSTVLFLVLVWFGLTWVFCKLKSVSLSSEEEKRKFQMVMDLHTELISISNDLGVHVKLLTKTQNHKTSSYYHAFLYVISWFCLFFVFEVKYEKSEICLHVNFSEINLLYI